MGYIDPAILWLMRFGYSLDDAITIQAAIARRGQRNVKEEQTSKPVVEEKKEDPRDAELKALHAKVEEYTRELGVCESQVKVLGKENALLRIQVDNLTKKLEEAEAVKAYALKMAELLGGKTEQPEHETGITEAELAPDNPDNKVQEDKKCETSIDTGDAQAVVPTPTRVKIRITPRRKE